MTMNDAETAIEPYENQTGADAARTSNGGLPAGFGHQFEIRTAATAASGVVPVLDRVTLGF